MSPHTQRTHLPSISRSPISNSNRTWYVWPTAINYFKLRCNPPNSFEPPTFGLNIIEQQISRLRKTRTVGGRQISRIFSVSFTLQTVFSLTELPSLPLCHDTSGAPWTTTLELLWGIPVLSGTSSKFVDR